jgi:hypothetical protein
MAMRYIPVSQRTWSEWHGEWCFLGFSEEDDHLTYTEPPATPEVLPSWDELTNIAGQEAAIETI